MVFFFRTTGREYIPKQGGCIIASNHLSFLDPIVLSVASPRILSFMAKQELFRPGLFMKLITALNAFPLQRGRADLKAMRMAIEKLKNGETLIIFPEGTRSESGIVQEGQMGVSMLAAKARVPVIPALIIGTDKAMPVHAKKVSLFKPVSVHFAAPLLFDTAKKGDELKAEYQRFSNAVIQSIKELRDSKK